MSAVEALFAAGWVGDFTGHATPSGAGSDERALLAAQRWLAEPERGRRGPVPKRADTRTQARLALELGRAALLDRDLRTLRRCAQAAAPHPEGRLLEAWLHWAAGRFEKAVRASEQAAAAQLDAPARIDAVVVRAHAQLEAGHMLDAASLARRAVRMARTEEFPQAQYAAGLCLARVRRARGAPHLAVRVLAALRRAASPPWRQAIAWEEAGCGVASDSPVGRWLEAAEDGRAATFAQWGTRIAEASAGWQPLTADFEAWRAVLDPDSAEPVELAPYLRGVDRTPPPRLRGLLFADTTADSGAFFCISPTRPARRLARRAEALLQARQPDLVTGTPPGRTGLALSALGLSGGNMSRARFFARVYGFAYEHRVHRGTLKALVHRVRTWLGDAGTIALDDDRVTLRLDRPISIADPSREDSLEERMLRYLAARGARSARDAAKALNMPLRSAQRTLSHLVEEGALGSTREGRGVAYHVEDTVFSLPTRWR